MRVLLDTNVLLRASQAVHAQHTDAVAVSRVLLANRHTLCVAAQSCYEFMAVATRQTANNGLQLSHEDAFAQLGRLLSDVEMLFDTPAVLSLWKRLLLEHQIVGKQVHDAHLAATAMVFDVDRCVTFNDADFRRYGELKVVTPAQMIGESA